MQELELELLHVNDVVVLVTLPNELVVLLDDISRYESHLDEGVDRALHKFEVDQFTVSVTAHLFQNGCADSLEHMVEALVTEEVEGHCGEGD